MNYWINHNRLSNIVCSQLHRVTPGNYFLSIPFISIAEWVGGVWWSVRAGGWSVMELWHFRTDWVLVDWAVLKYFIVMDRRRVCWYFCRDRTIWVGWMSQTRRCALECGVNYVAGIVINYFVRFHFVSMREGYGW